MEYATNLYSLHIGHNKGITDLNPVKDLTNLISLHIHQTGVSDISMLNNLTKLSTLTIHWNPNITDISVIENFKNLKTLELGGYQNLDLSSVFKKVDLTALKILDVSINNLTPFTSFNKLNSLHLEGNKISNISELSGLTNLNSLNLSNNQISDISTLSSLANLNTLYIHNNQISNVSVLDSLTNLNTLWLHGNQISDISALSGLNNLKDLRLQDNQILDISELSSLTNLTRLELNNNQISDISSLNGLDNLKNLYLYNNQISNISALSGLIKLNNLQLHNNQISDISALSGLTNLNTLSLDNNQISDISALSSLTKLNNLSLYNNQISDISTLRDLTNLNTLHLYNNQISDISTLRDLTNLTYLHLGDNQILDISALRDLTNLTYLHLGDNQILDISALRDLTNLKELYLYGQKPIIKVQNLKTETDVLDVSIKNPIIGLNNASLNISSISNSGRYEDGKLKWDNVYLGNHTRTFNFSENVKIGLATAIFTGSATLNLNVVDGGVPEANHTSEFDNNDFSIYTTVTADDLGVGVDYLIHKGVRQVLPYRFKYDVFDLNNNIVEVYDLAGNKAEYEVRLKDNDISIIEQGLDALLIKDDTEKENISYFRAIINDLEESSEKDRLQDKLNLVFPNSMSLDRKSVTSNMDLYIKSENMLQMTLDTNTITFEDFSGVEDMEKQNAVNITINSSLPYQLNAYLPTEIQNGDKSNTMDKSILNIKESSENNYQTFANTTDKIILKDNNQAGNDLSHNIDLKLKGGIAHEKDVYKATIKFEAQQK